METSLLRVMLKLFGVSGQAHSWSLVCGLLLLHATAPLMAATALLWTLEDSIRRAVEVAPEMRAARAAVNAQKGALRQAGAWPNP